MPTQIHVNGVEKRLRLPDQTGVRVAFMELLLADCYGLERIRQPVRTILDIGGNVGVFCLAARIAFPKAVIHSYEPNVALQQYLAVQADAANASYYMAGVMRESGPLTLDIAEDSVCTTSRYDPTGSVPGVAFRDALDRLGPHIDLVKMDCEGAEWSILQDEPSWSRVQNVTLEYHLTDGHIATEAVEAVAALGFIIKVHTPAKTFGLIHATRDA